MSWYMLRPSNPALSHVTAHKNSSIHLLDGMGELCANCPELNHVIEWVENVPVDARDTQVGSLDHRLVTRQQDKLEEMSSTAGLSHHRVGGHSSSGTTADDDTSSTSMNRGSRTNSPPIPASTAHQG
jgi:hypothetical protein